MKLKNIYVFFLAFVFLSITMSCNKGSSEEILWQPYKEGMDIGKKENKKIFIHFWASWCGYCTKMAKETFNDPQVVSYLNKHFITVKINSDNQKDIAAAYNVRGLPDNWFISENGEQIGNLPGYVPPDKLYLILQYIYTNSYKTMDFNQFSSTKK
jgi:thioredoxin-related protein